MNIVRGIRRYLTGGASMFLRSEFLEVMSVQSAKYLGVMLTLPSSETGQQFAYFRNCFLVVPEIGDFRRFPTPDHLMAYVGLVPSENSSGDRRRRGEINKAGDT
tara:strand:- start:7 stop:318 length:312 start_codon:yes stop_codon:yes gene_type:complete